MENFKTVTRYNQDVQEIHTLNLKGNSRTGRFEVPLSNGDILKVKVEFRTHNPVNLADYKFYYEPGFWVQLEPKNFYAPISSEDKQYVNIESYEMATKPGSINFEYMTYGHEIKFNISWNGNIAKGTLLQQIIDLFRAGKIDIVRTFKEYIKDRPIMEEIGFDIGREETEEGSKPDSELRKRIKDYGGNKSVTHGQTGRQQREEGPNNVTYISEWKEAQGRED